MKRMIAISLAASLLVTANVASAQPSYSDRPTSLPAGSDLGTVIYIGAQMLAQRAGILSKDKPIIVATTVSIDDLSRSSTFGRLASQLVANRLSQVGYNVKDMTFAGGVTVKSDTGELVLSHDAAQLSRNLGAQAVIAGTYAVGGREVFLNLRVLSPDDGQILSSADVVVPLDHNVEPLVGVLASR